MRHIGTRLSKSRSLTPVSDLLQRPLQSWQSTESLLEVGHHALRLLVRDQERRVSAHRRYLLRPDRARHVAAGDLTRAGEQRREVARVASERAHVVLQSAKRVRPAERPLAPRKHPPRARRLHLQ